MLLDFSQHSMAITDNPGCTELVNNSIGLWCLTNNQ